MVVTCVYVFLAQLLKYIRIFSIFSFLFQVRISVLSLPLQIRNMYKSAGHRNYSVCLQYVS